MPYRGKTNLSKGRNLQQTVCTHVDAAQSPTHLADHHAQQGMTTAEGCGKLGHWKPKCQSGQKGPKDKGPKHHNRGGKQRKVNEVGTDEDPHCDEVGVVTVVLQTPPHRE